MRSLLPARMVLLLVIALAAIAGLARSAAAHAQLESSNPAADALLSIPPTELTLTFTEPVDPTALTVTALDERGQPVQLDTPRLDSSSDRRLLVSSSGFSIGTYTVSWTNRSTTDGHPLSGSFAF